MMNGLDGWEGGRETQGGREGGIWGDRTDCDGMK